MHGTRIHDWIGAEFLCEWTQEVAFCFFTWVFTLLGVPENCAFHCAWDGARMSSCVSLCNPVDWSPPGSSIHGILQARTVEWVAISFSRGSSQLGIKPRSPALQADSLQSEPPGKPSSSHGKIKLSRWWGTLKRSVSQTSPWSLCYGERCQIRDLKKKV